MQVHRCNVWVYIVLENPPSKEVSKEGSITKRRSSRGGMEGVYQEEGSASIEVSAKSGKV